MKLGRNEPCHCGSGKKYKQCHLKLDKQANRSVSEAKQAEMPQPDENEMTAFQTLQDFEEIPTLETVQQEMAEILSTFSDELDESDDEAFNALHETILAADYDDVWQIIDQAIIEQPETMLNGEMIFEVADLLNRQVRKRNDQRRFLELIDRILTLDIEANELPYLYDFAAEHAIVLKDWQLLDQYFAQFSQIAGINLDLYYKVLSQYMYYRPIEKVIDNMQIAWPTIKAASGILEWVYEEYCRKLGGYELIYLGRRNPNITSGDKEVKDLLEKYQLTLGESYEDSTKLRAGRLQPQMLLGDALPELNYKKEYLGWLWRLINAFEFYAQTHYTIPSCHSLMAMPNLIGYFEHIYQVSGNNSKKRSKRKKGGKRVSLSQNSGSSLAKNLTPTASSLQVYIQEQLQSFLQTQWYEIAALLEILPVWLEFLVECELIKNSAEILRKLQPAVNMIMSDMRKLEVDQNLILSLEKWPDSLVSAAAEE